MITLSNGHSFEYMVASGALAFDGKGWLWERPLRWVGLIKPELFTVVIKTLTRKSRKGNLRMWKPWSCVRLLSGGSVVNKVGLTNLGVEWWCRTIGPSVDSKKIPLIGSIYADIAAKQELVEMANMLNDFDLVGLEVNTSCPNTGHPISDVSLVVDQVCAVKEVSRHPVIVKVSVAQDYCEIVRRLEGLAEAVSLNSVPWEIVYPPGGTYKQSPLWSLQKKVQGGGGGVSGKLAQPFNWKSVKELAQLNVIPVIAPSVMEMSDLAEVRALGASAISFGAIHLRTPWRPTSIVKRELIDRQLDTLYGVINKAAQDFDLSGKQIKGDS